MFPTKTILLTSKKKRYACNLKFEYLLDKNNQRVIKILPKMEINKTSTNLKNQVHKPPSTKTTNITTTFRKKKNPLTC